MEKKLDGIWKELKLWFDSIKGYIKESNKWIVEMIAENTAQNDNITSLIKIEIKELEERVENLGRHQPKIISWVIIAFILLIAIDLLIL